MCQSLALKPGEYAKTWKAVLQATDGRYWFEHPNGFARCETMDEDTGEWLWKPHVKEIIQIPIFGIGEKDTKAVGLSPAERRIVHEIERRDSIVLIVTHDDPYVKDKGKVARIVTIAATEDVSHLHDREPLLWVRDHRVWERIMVQTPTAA